MDQELVRGLRALLAYPGDDVESVFCRDFVISYRSFGEVLTVPLVPHGDQIPVTNQNRQGKQLVYIYRLHSRFLTSDRICGLDGPVDSDKVD
jgi:hypothetical protein